ADAADELAHDLRPFRIAEIQIVGNGERLGADRDQVAPAFSHGLLAAFEWIGLAIAGRDVGGECQAFRTVFDTHHRSISAGALYCIAENDVIVLFPHPTL